MVRRVFTRKGSANSSVVGTEQCVSEKAKAVLQLVTRKGPPLTLKQLDYCDEACIGRFLKTRGNNIKKAAKQLRATLSWRANLDVDYLTADEFSAELATGVAFVAGHDDDGKPVLVVRMKPEHLTTQAQKQFVRYFVFTMEVAMACMPSTSVEQCVLIFDAGCLRKGPSAGLSLMAQLLKLLGDHYPERVATIFIVDAPSVFHYLWKGIGAVLDVGVLKEKARFVFSRNYTNGIKVPATLIRTPRSNIAATSAASAATEPGDDKNRCEAQVSSANKNHMTNSTASSLTPNNHMTNSTASSLTPNSNCKSPTTPAPAPQQQQHQPSSKLASSNANSSSFRLYSSFFSSSAALLSDKASARSLSFASRWPSFNLTTPRPLKQEQPQQQEMHQGGDLDQELAAQADADQKPKKFNTPIRRGSILEFRSFRADTRSSRLQSDQGSSRRWADIAPALFSNSSSHLGSSNRITPPDQLLLQDPHIHDIHMLNSSPAAAYYDPNHIAQRSSLPHQNMMKSLDLFRPYYHAFLCPPYSEAAFRARMKPPLAGLISIISPDLKCHSFSLAAAEAQSMELAILHRLTFD